jgi:hypothetical protein
VSIVAGFFLSALGCAASAAPSPATGTYFGIIHGATFDQSGYVRMVIGKSGIGTVGVKLGDEKNCAAIVGPGGGGGPILRGPIWITLNPKAPMQTNLYLVNLPQGGLAFSGTITDDEGDTFTVTIPQTSTPDATAFVGQYTLLMESPTSGSAAFSNNVAGIGILNISKKGGLLFRGTLSDGTPLVQRGKLNSGLGWSLYAKGRHGAALSGEISFANDTQSDLSGALELAGPGLHGAPDSDVSLQLVGSRYSPAAVWIGGATWTLNTSDDQGVTINSTSSLANPGGSLLYSGSAGTQVTSGAGNFATAFLEQSTGLVAGGFNNNTLGSQLMLGVIFQKTSSAFGFTQQVEKPLTAIADLTNERPAAQKRAVTRAIASVKQAFKAQSPGIFALTADTSTVTTISQ